MKLIRRKDCYETAFNRLELSSIVCATIGLVILAALFITGPRQHAKIGQCAANLKLLGTGMTMYSEANGDQLPYIYLRYSANRFTTWDDLIYPFIPGGTITNRDGEKELTASRILRCPSDTIGVSKAAPGMTARRTYSMPWHQMNKANWPPGPTNSTGLGLWWTETKRLGCEMSQVHLLSTEEHIPSIHLKMIPDPSGTLLLAEKARKDNILFSHMGAGIGGVNEHLDTRAISMEDYHQGQFNYLMVDGSVKLLLPEQTTGVRGGMGTKNIWTIRPDD
jgi:prepilin-type processing-associated H-X9-DG protein